MGLHPTRFFSLYKQEICELVYIKMKQHISCTDEQMPFLDTHPVSLCNITPTPSAITAHVFMTSSFIYFLCMDIYIENFTKSSIRILSITPEETPLSVSLQVPLESKQGKTQLGSGWTVLWQGWQIWRYDQMQLLILHAIHSLKWKETIININYCSCIALLYHLNDFSAITEFEKNKQWIYKFRTEERQTNITKSNFLRNHIKKAKRSKKIQNATADFP